MTPTRRIALTPNRRRIAAHNCAVPIELGAFLGETRRSRTYPLCDDLLRRLERANPDAVVEDEVRLLVAEEEERLDRAAAVRPGDVHLLEPRLRSEQARGVRWLRAIGRGILADSQGTGKTVVSLVAAREAESLVVICSNVKRTDWVNHIRAWTDFQPRVMKSSDEATQVEPGEAVVIGYGAVGRSGKFLAPDLLVVDEAHTVRNRQTAAFKHVARLARRSRQLHLLTATPIVNAAEDVWSLLHLVNPQRFSSFWDFAGRFFEVKQGGFGIEIGGIRAEEEERFWRLIGRYMLQRDKDRSVLPVLRRKTIDYQLPSEQRELYQAMLEEGSATFAGHEVRTTEMVAKITRLRQLAIDPALVWPGYAGPSKLDALVAYAVAGQGRLVVFTMFADLANRAAKRLLRAGLVAGALTGETPAGQRDHLLASLDSGKLDALVLTHGTGGEGLNLVAASRLVFLDLNWHPAGNAQARDRIYRLGQKAPEVEVVYIRSRGTIEDHVLGILAEKRPVTIEDLTRKLEAIDD